MGNRGNGMRGMTGMQGIRVGMRGNQVGVRGIRVKMRGIRVILRENLRIYCFGENPGARGEHFTIQLLWSVISRTFFALSTKWMSTPSRK